MSEDTRISWEKKAGPRRCENCGHHFLHHVQIGDALKRNIGEPCLLCDCKSYKGERPLRAAAS